MGARVKLYSMSQLMKFLYLLRFGAAKTGMGRMLELSALAYPEYG